MNLRFLNRCTPMSARLTINRISTRVPRQLSISTRIYLSLIVAGMAFGLVAACGTDRSDHVNIRFWNGFTGPDGRTMLRLVKRFNREHPDVHVTMQRLDWATYYNKLFVAGIGRRAPDVFIVHAGNMQRFLQADFIRPVDDLLDTPEARLPAADMAPEAWRAVEQNGHHYGVPLDVHPLGLFYNRKLFRESGLVDLTGEPTPPVNREQFLDALRRLKHVDPETGTVRNWGFVFTWQRTNLLTLMYQFGGGFFAEGGTACTLDRPENVEALRFAVDIIREGLAPPPQDFDSWIGFRQGKVGMVFEGIYMLADLEKQTDLDWGAAPLPRLGTQPAVWADSHTLCLRGDLDGRRLDAAWRLIHFLSEHSLEWAEGGQVPVRRSLRTTDRFRAMEAQATFARQLPHIRYVPRVPFVFEFLTEFDIAVEKALRGSAPPAQALADGRRRVNEILERHRSMQAETERPG